MNSFSRSWTRWKEPKIRFRLEFGKGDYEELKKKTLGLLQGISLLVYYSYLPRNDFAPKFKKDFKKVPFHLLLPALTNNSPIDLKMPYLQTCLASWPWVVWAFSMWPMSTLRESGGSEWQDRLWRHFRCGCPVQSQSHWSWRNSQLFQTPKRRIEPLGSAAQSGRRTWPGLNLKKR